MMFPLLNGNSEKSQHLQNGTPNVLPDKLKNEMGTRSIRVDNRSKGHTHKSLHGESKVVVQLVYSMIAIFPLPRSCEFYFFLAEN